MIQKQKKKTWSWFSKYIRLKYSDHNGICECYTCGRQMKWNDRNCQAGHAIGGRTNNILFNEDIVRVQCYGCNVCQFGKLDEFGDKIKQEIGEEKYLEALRSKRFERYFTEQELLDMEETYKQKAKELAREKGIYFTVPKKRQRLMKESTVILAKLYPNRKRSQQVLRKIKRSKKMKKVLTIS